MVLYECAVCTAGGSNHKDGVPLEFVDKEHCQAQEHHR